MLLGFFCFVLFPSSQLDCVTHSLGHGIIFIFSLVDC